MKLHRHTPHESRMGPCRLWGQRVKRSRSQCLGQVKWFHAHNCFPFTPTLMKLNRHAPHNQGWALLRLVKIVFMRLTASPLHLSSQNSIQRRPMSRGCVLLILGSKGQRSRSQCIDCWKWLLSRNCFPFIPVVMKLHTKNPLEGRACPMDFGVKRSKVKVTLQ